MLVPGDALLLVQGHAMSAQFAKATQTLKTPAELLCNANSQFLRELGTNAYRLKSCLGLKCSREVPELCFCTDARFGYSGFNTPALANSLVCPILQPSPAVLATGK